MHRDDVGYVVPQCRPLADSCVGFYCIDIVEDYIDCFYPVLIRHTFILQEI